MREIAVHLADAGDVFVGVFVLSFFPRDALDEIWDLIESVSEGFPTYSCSITVLSHEKLSRGKWYSVRKAIRQFSILPPTSDLNHKI